MLIAIIRPPIGGEGEVMNDTAFLPPRLTMEQTKLDGTRGVYISATSH